MRPTILRTATGVTVAGSLIAVGVAGSASAADVDVVVAGGSLTITAPAAANFTAVVLDGTAKEITAPLGAFSVVDATGTGAGWNVSAQATRFTTGGENPRTLPASWLSMSAPSVAADGTTSAAPSVTPGPYAIGAGAVKVASAAADEGMGTYDFGATTLTLTLPASVHAGTYTSTVTMSVTSGP